MGTTAQSLLKNRYELHELIGIGGMATVYRGVDTTLGREVAIKVFAASADDIEGARQEDEVNVLASLSHHSLVTLLDAGVDRADRDNPRVFLVMELVRGADLQRTLINGPLNPRQIGQIGYDIAEGLQYIHRQGVIHRDVKPANILLADHNVDDTRTRAMLTDFGIAHRGARTQEVGATTTGTAAYLSPEQARREEVGPASDIYSLGLVLLECFTGEIAFPGSSVDSTMARLISDPPIPKSIGSDWRSLLSAMTALKPEHRPEAAELVLALRDLIAAETGRHRDDEAIIPTNEASRIEAVRRFDLLDTPSDGAFDRITALAARVLKTPVAIVSIVDTDRIWFKSKHGLDVDQIGRDPGLCASVVYYGEPWIVENARLDPRTLANPLVASEFGLQFYAGVPLTTSDGFHLGTLCVLDFEPRIISDDELATLTDLGEIVMSEMEIRLASRQLLLGDPADVVT